MGVYDCDNYNDLMARIDRVKKRNKAIDSPTPMSGTLDLISREEAIDMAYDCEDEFGKDVAFRFAYYLRHLPSVQPERKKGTWIEFDSDNDKYDEIKCNRCEKIFTVDAYHWTDIGFTKDDLKFCPHCGADMRGEQP